MASKDDLLPVVREWALNFNGVTPLQMIDELRAHFMAATINCPGLSTLFDNLYCAFSRPPEDLRRAQWLNEYFEGADKELTAAKAAVYGRITSGLRMAPSTTHMNTNEAYAIAARYSTPR